MKVVGIVGSPRKNGNTEIITDHALNAIAEEGLDTELIRLAGRDIRPCTGCLACKQDETCTVKDDLLPLYLKMKEADAILLATPVYFSGPTGLVRSFMERTGHIAKTQNQFKGKVGGPLVVARRAGHNFVHAELQLWFHIMQIISPGAPYWTIGFGRNKGEVENDTEGLNIVNEFARNIADTLKRLNS